MPTLRYYVVQTTFNPGVWIKVDEHEYEQLSELGRIEGIPQGPIDPTVFDTEMSEVIADVNSLTRAVVAAIPPDPHTHPVSQIADSGIVGRLIVQANTGLEARAASGAGTASTKADVGLGNADNTSDVNKPVSTAQQTALNLKAPLASPAFTGTPTGITKTHVGLSNVDNTSDANKPVSTAQAAADATKVPIPGADPDADRLLFWDDSAGAWAYLALGTNLSITGTTLNSSAAVTGIRIWSGGVWSARPAGFPAGFVTSYSDGTKGSTRDAAATDPGGLDGDDWYGVLA